MPHPAKLTFMLLFLVTDVSCFQKRWDCISFVRVAARLMHRLQIKNRNRGTYTWRVVEGLCVLLILLVKSFVLQKETGQHCHHLK